MSLFNNLTLQKRISLIVLIGLVVGLSLFSWLGIQSVNDSVDKILEERLTTARLIASHLDENLEHVLLHVQNYADFNGGFPTEEEFRSAAVSLQDRLAESGFSVNNIMITGSNGVIQYVANPSPVGAPLVIRSTTANHQKIVEAREKQIPTISSLVSDSSMRTPVVLISAPVLNENGESIGVFTALVDIAQSNIGAFNQPVTIGKTGYTEIVDGNGIVLSRTSPASPPERFEQSDHPAKFAQLIDQGQAAVRTCHRCHETETALERRRDILAFAPLSTASWGVAIRQAEEEALAPTRQLQQRLLFLGIAVLVGAFLLVWAMGQGIVKPLKMLTAATRKVAAGDFKAAAPARRHDEIGELSTAFYIMTQELVKSRDELMSRNEELSALNSITSTISQSLDLEYVLGNSLQQVLEVTKAIAGGVFLRNASGDGLEIMSNIGLSSIFQCPNSGSNTNRCACHQVMRSGQTLMVNDVSQCPMIGKDTVTAEGISCFVSVPLKSKDRTLGIMNVACSSDYRFNENDFKLLDSIGYHVGLAIDNSVLYQEVKHKEELRGQLLNSIINAQEEERKRIARELHDEYGQTLTGLIMSIESLENTALPEDSILKAKLARAKSMVIHALQDTRRLTLDLRPSTLDDLGLVATVRSYVEDNLEAEGINVDFRSQGLSQRLGPAVETALFRIIQEASHNITKYAAASNVKIYLEYSSGIITASIEDDGRGFDVEAVFKSRIGTQSLGLLGIQERVNLLGGNFHIESEIGRGTRLVVEIPISSSLEAIDSVKRTEV